MCNEKAEVIELIDNEKKINYCKFYISFCKQDAVEMAIYVNNQIIKNEDYNYTQCLIGLMKKLPEGSRLKFHNRIYASTTDKPEIINIDEIITLIYLDNIEDYHLKFDLRCNCNNNFYETTSTEDFSIALQKLSKKTNLKFEICAYCKYADFKSYGDEDLRHGWYCFRELSKVNFDLPWYERLDDFEKAIPNISTFHWCPKFTLVENKPM